MRELKETCFFMTLTAVHFLFFLDHKEGDAMSVAFFVESAQLIDAIRNLRDMDIGGEGFCGKDIALHRIDGEIVGSWYLVEARDMEGGAVIS